MSRLKHATDGALPMETTNQVEIAPPTGITVLIIGAGVGGLVAALECTRKGHSVRIFERESAMNSAGDMFTIGLSGRKWFSHWPEMAKELANISLKGMLIGYHKHNGEIVIPATSPAGPPKGPPPGGPPMMPQIRPLFHAMLYNQLQRLGVELICDKQAIEYFETENYGGVVTADGQRAEADIVIAADGIGSTAQNLILGERVRGTYSGHSIFRTAYPLEVAMKDPFVKDNFGLIDGKPVLRAFYGPETHGMIFSTKDTISWAIDHKGSEADLESWNKAVTNEEVIRTMDETPGWSESVKALVQTTPPGNVVNYPLVLRDPQSKWTSPNGRVITLGDSAHTFLPTSGNGATQAIEDAITIASCLQLSADRKHVPTAARAYVKLRYNLDKTAAYLVQIRKYRFERVANAQRLGFFNKQRVQDVDWEAAKKDPSRLRALVPKWLFTHDPEKYVYDNYSKVVESFEDNTAPFTNTNVPPGSTYRPWTMDELLDDIKNNRQVEMEGDWS